MFSTLKLKPCSLVFAGILVSATTIADEHKAYVQFNAGAAFSPSFTLNEQNNNFFGSSSFSYKEDYDTGYTGSVAIGYRIADQFRLEAEGIYQSNARNKFNETFSFVSPNFSDSQSFSGDLKGQRERSAFLLNGYYDFKNSTAFTPFITAGMGGYHIRLKTANGSSDNDLDFAWQAGAGVNYKLNDSISFDLKYRYFGGADAEIKNQNGPSDLYAVGDHQAIAGIRIGF